MSIKHLPVNYLWSSKTPLPSAWEVRPCRLKCSMSLFYFVRMLNWQPRKSLSGHHSYQSETESMRERTFRMKMNVRWHWLSHTQTFSICDSLGSSDRSRGHKALVLRQLTQWLRSRVSLRVSPKYRRVSTVWFMPGLRFVGLFCHSQGKKRNGWHKETFLLSGGNVERWRIFLFQCSFEVCDQEMCFS